MNNIPLNPLSPLKLDTSWNKSNCCGAPFFYRGVQATEICSKCGANSDITEVWVPIDFVYPHVYFVSSYGDVGSYTETYRKGMALFPKILKPFINNCGYPQVRLFSKMFLVSRIVALHFVPNPLNKPTVEHIDNIKINNKANNLTWFTSREQAFSNWRHRKKKAEIA